MSRAARLECADWQRFVIEHGSRADVNALAAVLGRTVEEIIAFRRHTACLARPRPLGFEELFQVAHGRSPEDDEYPAPMRAGANYEWLPPELKLLASLVGMISYPEIAEVLTERLRQVTKDPQAERKVTAVVQRANDLGLRADDIVGGLTAAQAGREIGSPAAVYQAIKAKRLKARYIGRLLVIARADWESWKSRHSFPPEGYVLLSSIREALGIASDAKLPEFATLGYIPSAVRCKAYGEERNTRVGRWYISPQVAAQLVEDRRAGRPMPWHGKPMPDNLKATYRKWSQRRHPAECQTCREIWGAGGAPADFAAFCRQYPPLELRAKRHLTNAWTAGLTVAEVANKAGVDEKHVRRAIAGGTLIASEADGRQHVGRIEATKWIARGAPTGDSMKSWASASLAQRLYAFSAEELAAHAAAGRIRTKLVDNGPSRGQTFYSKVDCATARQRLGYTAEEAARRVGVTQEQLVLLLEGTQWRVAPGIPLEAIRTAIKRLQAPAGTTPAEAAKELHVSLRWVHDRIADGSVKLLRRPWDPESVGYLSPPMMTRLRALQFHVAPTVPLSPDLMKLSAAALEAGVCTTTITRWDKDGLLTSLEQPDGRRYQRDQVREQARLYWKSVRFRRGIPPAWLQDELEADASDCAA